VGGLGQTRSEKGEEYGGDGQDELDQLGSRPIELCGRRCRGRSWITRTRKTTAIETSWPSGGRLLRMLLDVDCLLESFEAGGECEE